MNTNNIFKQLIEIQKNSYSPYSKYPVSAILVSNDEQLFSGVNIENASFGLTVCAERNALALAINSGVKNFKELHILCANTEVFGVPCGACRQVLTEFCFKNDLNIYSYNKYGEFKITKLSTILPFAFNNSYL